MSFVLTFPWRALILAMSDWDCANKAEIEIFVFSVTSNDFAHDLLLDGLKGNACVEYRTQNSYGLVAITIAIVDGSSVQWCAPRLTGQVAGCAKH